MPEFRTKNPRSGELNVSLQARWYYAGEHAADLAAVDAKRSSKQAQHAQEIAQMEARHRGQIAELKLQLE